MRVYKNTKHGSRLKYIHSSRADANYNYELIVYMKGLKNCKFICDVNMNSNRHFICR